MYGESAVSRKEVCGYGTGNGDVSVGLVYWLVVWVRCVWVGGRKLGAGGLVGWDECDCDLELYGTNVYIGVRLVTTWLWVVSGLSGNSASRCEVV
jgi:hypothetical protein